MVISILKKLMIVFSLNPLNLLPFALPKESIIKEAKYEISSLLKEVKAAEQQLQSLVDRMNKLEGFQSDLLIRAIELRLQETRSLSQLGSQIATVNCLWDLGDEKDIDILAAALLDGTSIDPAILLQEFSVRTVDLIDELNVKELPKASYYAKEIILAAKLASLQKIEKPIPDMRFQGDTEEALEAKIAACDDLLSKA